MGVVGDWFKKQVATHSGWVKFVLDAIGIVRSVIWVAVFFGVLLGPPVLTTSSTLWAFVYGFGALGGILGYVVTSRKWKKLDTDKQLELATWRIGGAFAVLLIGVLVIVTAKPEPAERFAFVGELHEFWTYTMPLFNFVVGLFWGWAAYLLIAGITVLAPHVNKDWKPPPPDPVAPTPVVQKDQPETSPTPPTPPTGHNPGPPQAAVPNPEDCP